MLSSTRLARPSCVALRRIEGISAYLTVGRFGLNPIETMQRIHDRHGPLTEIVCGAATAKRTKRYVLAVGSKYNRRVLSDPTIFESIGVMLPGPKGSAQRRISNGLLGPSGARHKHYRRMLLPPLRRAAVDSLADRMSDIVDREIAEWPLNRPLDIFPLIKKVTLSVTLESLFPSELGCGRSEAAAAARIMNDHIAMESSPAVRGCPMDLPGTPYRDMLRHSEVVEASLAAWVQADGPDLKSDNLMSILAHSVDECGAPPTPAVVLSQLPTLFAATFETSQTSLTWALFLLAQHPEAASRLLEEIQELPEHCSASAEQLAQSPLLDAVVKESLRLLPSVPTQTRRTTCDTDLVDCDLKVGTYVVLSAFLTNRDPALFPDAGHFRPQRWAHIDPTQYEYLAFSAGQRSCIGAWFATTFLKVALSRIMRRYRLSVVQRARIDQRVRLTMSPKASGMPMTIHPQDGRFKASAISGNILNLVAAPA
ncbi:MAG: cytochrome P450 [Pseudomonadota bacterium]